MEKSAHLKNIITIYLIQNVVCPLITHFSHRQSSSILMEWLPIRHVVKVTVIKSQRKFFVFSNRKSTLLLIIAKEIRTQRAGIWCEYWVIMAFFFPEEAMEGNSKRDFSIPKWSVYRSINFIVCVGNGLSFLGDQRTL